MLLDLITALSTCNDSLLKHSIFRFGGVSLKCVAQNVFLKIYKPTALDASLVPVCFKL